MTIASRNTDSSPVEERPPFVTQMLLAVIVFAWVATILLGSPERIGNAVMNGPPINELLLFGANQREAVLARGETWRLVSACFLHGGLLHIAFNGYALALYGPLLERYLGGGRFLFLYVAAGVGGSLMSLGMHADVVSVGASGAIFGMVGALLAIMKRRGAPASSIRSLTFIVAANFAIGMTPGSHIDNWAHAGGLITGLALGFLLPGHAQIRRGWDRLTEAVAMTAALAVLAYAGAGAGSNLYHRLLRPETMPLATARSLSGDFEIAVPAGWTRGSDGPWEFWAGGNRTLLLVGEMTGREASRSRTLNGAAELSREVAESSLGSEGLSELSVRSRESARLGDRPAYRFRIFANVEERIPLRFTTYVFERSGRSFFVAMLSPSELAWPDLLLERIAASLMA